MRVNKVVSHNLVQGNKLMALYDANAAIKLTDPAMNGQVCGFTGAPLLPETITFINRVHADGGTIVNAQWIDTIYRTLKSQDLYP
jgi:hypothetical protein